MRLFPINRSLSQATFVISFGVIVLIFIALGLFWLYSQYRQFKTESQTRERQLLDAQRKNIAREVENVIKFMQFKKSQTEDRARKDLQQRVNEAHAVATYLYNRHKDTKPLGEIKTRVREALRPIRFNQGRGYFFATALDGVEQLFADKPQLEGKNLIDMQDTRGKYVIRDMIAIARNATQGFYEYTWTKPNVPGRDFPKIAFVRYFKPFNWFLGTGEYLDDMEIEIQSEVLERVGQIRFGRDGYIFVLRFDGVCLSHINPQFIGRDVLSVTDKNGIKINQALLEVSRRPAGGYVNYAWEKPSSGRVEAKLGYARAFEPWGWVVGTGVYLEDIQKTLAGQQKRHTQALKNNIISFGVIFFVAIVMVGLLVRFLTRRLQKGVSAFTRFFDRAAFTNETIDIDRLTFSEFKQLGDYANQMIDARRQAEQEQRSLEKQLQRSQKMEALGILAGGVAHDLNNILSGIVSYPDLLLMQEPEESPMTKPLKTIKASGEKAAAIVQDLLTMARRGVQSLDVVNLNQIVTDFLNSPEYEGLKAAHPDIRITVDTAPRLLNVLGSRIHLSKTLMNLVFNAAEAASAGGNIRIKTANHYIEKAFGSYDKVKGGEYALLSVSDDGVGISETDRERIFEPFYTKKVMGRSGTGLGMAVVWGTVKDHNGYIDIDSSEGQGTTFHLYFPITREKLKKEQTAKTADEFRGRGESILVVDDKQSQREIACGILTQLGYNPVAVASGEEALAHMAHHSPDLVLLDMIMDNGMDGLDTYREMVARRPGQKAVIASGYSESDRVRAAQRLGAGPYLKKPYTVENLGATIRKMLDE